MLGLAVGERLHHGPWETNASRFAIAYLGPLAIDEITRRGAPRAGKGAI